MYRIIFSKVSVDCMLIVLFHDLRVFSMVKTNFASLGLCDSNHCCIYFKSH